MCHHGEVEAYVSQFEAWAKTAIDFAALLVELVAMGVIVVASARSAYRLVSPRWRSRPNWYGDIRIDLGRSIILALEFLIGADILRTAINPTWTTLGQLAITVAIRTWLDYFLERELKGIVQNREPDG
jgi:uncharacterized membrane protein